MNCPYCGIRLMGGMTVCPKCKYNVKEADGGEKHKQWVYEQTHKEEIEAQRRAEELARLTESVQRFSGSKRGTPEIIYHIDGARGRSIDIYPFKCVISIDAASGPTLASTDTEGQKTIYYQDCIGFQVKYPGFTHGFIHFETASSVQNDSSINFFNENTFTYDPTQISVEEMSIVVNYIKKQFDKIKEAQCLSWMKV